MHLSPEGHVAAGAYDTRRSRAALKLHVLPTTLVVTVREPPLVQRRDRPEHGVRRRLSLEGRDHPGRPARIDLLVFVHECDDLTPGLREPPVSRPREPRRSRVEHLHLPVE